MKADIDIVNNKEKFKYRVSGLLIKDNKLLVVKINNNSFYCLPGGHVTFMEDTKKAIVREYKEETGIEVIVKKLVYITENFFESGKYNCHEVGMYYLLDTKEDIKFNDYIIEEKEDDGITKLTFKWMDINNLENIKPEFLKNRVLSDYENIKHLIIRNDKVEILE